MPYGGERTGTRRIGLPRPMETAPSVDRKGASAEDESMKIVMAIIKPLLKSGPDGQDGAKGVIKASGR